MDVDPKELAEVISRVLKRLADKGWVASTAIGQGRLHVEYTEIGKERMRVLRQIFIDELHMALKPIEFQALIGLLLQFDSSPQPPSEGHAETT
jgi:DNA-binding PadR family transcriptional regulator